MKNSIYNIEKEGKNKYIFFTGKGIEYQIVVKNSGIITTKSILEIDLNCDINTAVKDYKTLRTIVEFGKQVSEFRDAFFIQIHNQSEIVLEDKVKRRGKTRLQLWNRIIEQNFQDFILLNNLVLNPNEKSDILSLALRKNTPMFKEYVTDFYRFCHKKMYNLAS